MALTREYEEFLKEEIGLKQLTFYEKACNVAGKIFPISPPSSIGKKYQQAIGFSHMNVTPKQAFSLAILATLLILIPPSAIAVLIGFTDAAILFLIFSLIAFIYL